ncbi:MAG: hypothetical protein ACJ789_01980 [Thermomicrobiales bacterium]
MPNWRFWEKQAKESTGPATLPGRTAVIGEPVPKPIESPPPPIADDDRRQRLRQLQRRREGALFDLAQARLALEEDNPWQQRIALLSEALESVERDLEALEQLPKREVPGLPATPIAIDGVRAEEPAAVKFRVGEEAFHFEADLDWAERGGPVVHGELLHRSGNPEALIPNYMANDLRSELAAHLTDSLFVFATDLRDRAVNDEPLPANPTLADLAQPCPDCGGWRDWRGNCAECKRRQLRRQQLEAEGQRLDREREAESDDQEKWAERVPVARRRLADIDVDIAALGE